MDQAATIAVIVLFIVLGLALGGTIVGAVVAAFTGARVRWIGRMGLGIAGTFASALALALAGAYVPPGPARLGLAVAGGVLVVLVARALRRALVASSEVRHRDGA